MALKPAKATTPPEPVAQSVGDQPIKGKNHVFNPPDLNLEDAIADQLLDDIDWSKVRAALIRKAPARLFAWLAGGNNTPINISQFPELAALPSSDNEGKAA